LEVSDQACRQQDCAQMRSITNLQDRCDERYNQREEELIKIVVIRIIDLTNEESEIQRER
jgi:hypothetical protein